MRSCPPVEDLEDLDALPLFHAELGDEVVGVHPQPVGVGDLFDCLAGFLADAVELLGAEDDVLEDGEVVGQHVLEDHPDAGVDRVGRAAQREGLAVDRDGALVGLLDAVEDLHQRRLAGAVLLDDGVQRCRAGR